MSLYWLSHDIVREPLFLYHEIRKKVVIVGHWIPYNPNPEGRSADDCAVRACTIAVSKDWDTVFLELSVLGCIHGDMISGNHVWGRYLKRYGFRRALVDDDCETCYTVNDFCREHPKGTYVLALSGHVVAVQDGCYLDSWDSGAEVPIFYWYKESD